jgi:hypothetical protein
MRVVGSEGLEGVIKVMVGLKRSARGEEGGRSIKLMRR